MKKKRNLCEYCEHYKAEYAPFIGRMVMTCELKPIKLPYVPETHKVYVQHEKTALGILYFMDTDKERSMVPIKRFFAIKRDPVLSFEEISWAKFREIAEVEDGNDK